MYPSHGYDQQHARAYRPTPRAMSGWRFVLGFLFVLGSLWMLPIALVLFVATQTTGAASALCALGVPLFFGGSLLMYRDRVRVRRANEEAERRRLAYLADEQQRIAREREERRLHEEQRQRDRFAALSAKFGAEAADSIMRGRLWVGAPEAAVREVYGEPDDVEERVLKTKSKRILKYRDPTHAGRYVTKVTVENGAVIGWEDR